MTKTRHEREEKQNEEEQRKEAGGSCLKEINTWIENKPQIEKRNDLRKKTANVKKELKTEKFPSCQFQKRKRLLKRGFTSPTVW